MDEALPARSESDPPRFYLSSFVDGAWDGWEQIPLNIKARQAVPAVYAGHKCLFWLEAQMANEPDQNLPPAQPSDRPPSQEVDRYVTLTLYFSTFRNGAWMPAQEARGPLFDKPPLNSFTISRSKAVEALYTLKVRDLTESLQVDVFRLGEYADTPAGLPIIGVEPSTATHLGRAAFDGRFGDLQLRNCGVPSGLLIPVFGFDLQIAVGLLDHAQATYFY